MLNSGRSLTISHCIVRNFVFHGIILEPAGATNFLIGDTLVSDNADGIFVVPQAHGSARGTLDHVLVNNSRTFGLEGGGAAAVTSVYSRATNNTGTGFLTGGGVLLLAHSAATENAIGVDISFGTGESFGDNDIQGNATDVLGAMQIADMKVWAQRS